jgi:hypothetical protein
MPTLIMPQGIGQYRKCIFIEIGSQRLLAPIPFGNLFETSFLTSLASRVLRYR